MDSELKKLAEQELQVLIRDFPMKRHPRIVWRNYRTTAGMASYREQLVMLSTIVLDEEAKLISTLRHEYAHLLAFDRHGVKGRGHGAAWIKAMHDLGMEPSVTHRYSVKRNVARQVVIYQCIKCSVTFERKRRLAAKRKYLHVGCGGTIKLVKIESEMNSKQIS